MCDLVAQLCGKDVHHSIHFFFNPLCDQAHHAEGMVWSHKGFKNGPFILIYNRQLPSSSDLQAKVVRNQRPEVMLT